MLFVLLVFSLPPCPAPAVQQADTETDLRHLSSSIAGNLQSLRLESELMVSQLTRLHETLSQSETERLRLEAQSRRLSSSLTLINRQLSDCYSTITAYEERLAARGKALAVMLAVLAARLVGMVAGYILYARGVRLPRWLDILL